MSSAHCAARSGSRATSGSAPAAWIAMTLMLWATASCSSRATRMRSAVIAACASCARACSSRAAFSVASAMRWRWPRTIRPTTHGSATPPMSAGTMPLG